MTEQQKYKKLTVTLNSITIGICICTMISVLYVMYGANCQTVKLDYVDTSVEPNVRIIKYEKHCSTGDSE